MDLGPFFAALEKLGMFGIAGYLVWHMVKNNDALITQIKEMVEKWSDSSDKTLEVLKEIDTRLERSETERAELIKALARVRGNGSEAGYFTATFIFLLVILATMLAWHSHILTKDLDVVREQAKERGEKVEALESHERELQTALVAGETTRRSLEEKHQRVVKELRNAIPNDCTDAPVSADIDRILREQSIKQSLGYLPNTGIGIAAAPIAGMGRQDQPRYGGVLFGEPARCIGV